MVYHLAQINIAKFRHPVDHPDNIEFVANLDRVNAIAEKQTGFVWRLVGEGNNALDLNPFEDPNTVINMSVWRDMDALAAFVYRMPAHRDIMRRRREWFDPIETYMALWWVEAGYIPTIGEGQEKLEKLVQLGSTPHAFTFKVPFPAPDGGTAQPIFDKCA